MINVIVLNYYIPRIVYFVIIIVLYKLRCYHIFNTTK